MAIADNGERLRAYHECTTWTDDKHARRAALPGREKEAKRLRDGLVVDNLPLVHRVARRVLGSKSANPDNVEEAVQEGVFGLMTAIDRYEAEKGAFSTFAGYWIRHHVQTCVQKQGDFVKQRQNSMPAAVAKAANQFRLLYGREPEPEDLGVARKDWDEWLDSAFVFSVDSVEPGEDGSPEEAALLDKRTDPEHVIRNAHVAERFEEALKIFSPRNQDMTRALFLEGLSVRDAADEFGVSFQRVGAIRKVLEKRLRKVIAS